MVNLFTAETILEYFVSSCKWCDKPLHISNSVGEFVETKSICLLILMQLVVALPLK